MSGRESRETRVEGLLVQIGMLFYKDSAFTE